MQKDRISSTSSHKSFGGVGKMRTPSTTSQNGFGAGKVKTPSTTSQNGIGTGKVKTLSSSSQNGFNGGIKERFSNSPTQNGLGVGEKERFSSSSSQNGIGTVKERFSSSSSQNVLGKDGFSSTSSQNSLNGGKARFTTNSSSQNGKGSGKVLEMVAFLNQNSQQDGVISEMGRRESAKKDMKPLQAPRLIKRLEDCHAKEGSAGKFKCKFSSSNGELKIVWFRDDVKIEESKEYSMLTEADSVYILVVTCCSPDIEGTFTCEATNKRGSVKTSAKLLVECLHVINSHKMNGTVVEGEKLPLEEKPLKERKKIEIRLDDVGNYYELLETLGRGKFGEVKKCTHKETKTDFAAKFIKCRPSQKKTVINEIDILNALNHKNIIQLVDVYEYGGQFVLVQELVSGGELFEKLIDEEYISEMDVSLYIEQLLHALKHMHGLGIIHLDLKPENIMLVEKNCTLIKLIDFGVARHMEKDLKVTFGTTEFLSPEVVNYDPVTSQTDMWTVGVIMYVLVSGYSPFSGDNDLETLGNISKCNWDFDDPAFDDISKEAKDFITKLLVRVQSKRSTSEKCLQHPWLKLKANHKSIETEKLISFTARRKWKKSIAVVQTANYLGRVGDKVKGMLDLVQEKKAALVDETIPLDIPVDLQEPTSPASPSIVKEIEDCAVAEGEAATFTCYISGHPLSDIKWYKEDELLVEGKQYSMLMRSEHCYVLLITHSTPEIEGLYTCEATNSEGSAKSSGTLTVESLHRNSHHSDNEEEDDDENVGDLDPKDNCEVRNDDLAEYYTTHEELGRGAFGVVYKCIEKKTQETFAAKIMKAKPAQRKSILNEIDILNSLNHKCIIKLVNVFEYSGQFALVSELVSGGELFQRLVEEEFISELDVVFYIKQVIHAARHMHKRGILHLDLKPENILLVANDSSQIKLIDFGLACRTGKNVKVLFGTAEFISPEVINYQPVSPATDMWSIGVITYVLLSGYTPFDGDTESEILSNITNGIWDFDDSVFDDISDEAKDFISNLIVRDPKQRASSKQCLEHPWMTANNNGQKKIRTEKLISFMARRNWRRSIAVVQTANYFGKLTDRLKELAAANDKNIVEEPIKEEPEAEQKLHNGDASIEETHCNGET